MLAVFAATPAAFADVGADAVILNVVRVNYTDASGNQAFSADAAASVTISLVESGLTISGRPTLATPGTGSALPAEQTVASGTTAAYLYALTATANGDDEYYLSAAIDAVNNATNETVAMDLMAPDGLAVIAANPASVIIEASVIVDVLNPTTLVFPGNTLTGLTAGEVLVVNGVDYLVNSVTVGNPASHTYADGAAHSDLGVLTPETRVEVELAANPSGAQAAPGFDGTYIGLPVQEQVLLRVQVYAEANIAGTDGTVDVDLNTATDNGFTTNVVGLDDVTTTYTAVNLTIQKLVRNLTTGGAFAATANGVTTNVLEYQVTITNTGSGDADNVIVTDAVPDYTTLVESGANFAVFTGPSGGGNITSAVDLENQPDGVSGDHGGVVAGSPLTFYVGQNQDGVAGTGGVVQNGQTFVITYQVRID